MTIEHTSKFRELPWQFYQEWNNTLFMHWEISPEMLRALLPKGLEVDMFEGKAYVSLVAFSMKNVRPRNVFAVPGISHFHELNIRTYLRHKGVPGVYFLSIEAGSRLSAWLCRTISGLDYRYSTMKRKPNRYYSVSERGTNFAAEFSHTEQLEQKTELDLFLTERYFVFAEVNEKLIRYEVCHEPWPLNEVELKDCALNYQIGTKVLSAHPALVHYSPGVKVVSLKKEIVAR